MNAFLKQLFLFTCFVLVFPSYAEAQTASSDQTFAHGQMLPRGTYIDIGFEKTVTDENSPVDVVAVVSRDAFGHQSLKTPVVPGGSKIFGKFLSRRNGRNLISFIAIQLPGMPTRKLGTPFPAISRAAQDGADGVKDADYRPGGVAIAYVPDDVFIQ